MALDITTLASTDLLSDSRGDINTNFTNIATDLDALSDNLENLTDGEVTQLEAIGATTISAAQWAYLGDLDQALKKASSITFADLTLSGLTASELTATDASKKLQSLAVATYPSLTEISYIKGLSSAIQTQLAGKAAVDQTMYIGTTGVAINRTTAALTLAGLTLTTPNLGTPSAGTLTNCTFPTLNQNTTGTAANLSGTPNLGIGTLGCGAITSTGAITGNPVGILNLVSVNNAYGLNLTSYFANAAYSDYIYFKKSHSDTEAYVSTPTATIFGSIWAYGVGTDADKWDLSTSIRFEQDGAAGANYVPGKIVFKTGTNAAAPADALTLNSDKSVDLAGTARVAGDPATDGYFVIKLSGVSYKVPCLAV